jgi:hypothetical protein
MIDLMAVAIRWPVCPLDQRLLPNHDPETPTVTHREMLTRRPDRYSHEPLRAGYSASNPVIIRRILDQLESADARRAVEGVEISRCFLANVQVPKGTPNNQGVVEQMSAAVDAARARHDLP